MELEDEDCQSQSDENMYLIFRKFKEFLMHKKYILNSHKQIKER